MKFHRLMRAFAILTAIGAYIMVLMGAIVSKTGSGRGCGGSWPFCHGQLIPESMPIETVLEYSHRIVSGLDGALILILMVWSWLTFRHDFRVKFFGGLSLFFVILQGALGALTVMFEGTMGKYVFLAFHFGFSLISFASVILLTIRLFQIKPGQQADTPVRERKQPAAKVVQYGAWLLAVITYIVIYTGALVRHTEATMACGFQFPGCGPTIFPNFSTLAGIQMLHRFCALSLWLLSLIFFVLVARLQKGRRDIFWTSLIAFALFTAQALSGWLTIASGGQLMAALLHSTIISACFTVLCYNCILVEWPWKKRPVENVQLAARGAQ
ncbi:cytochrome c oxidase assembly protein subunit 15 [Thermosporothrix hazakensis]|uniref:Cytochrome c oxidase assembly protein subunit 15 n=1 Tax=Thermosporothrix hazakensis TaxID=644383 RepID=A0A326UAL8_THEHA|nr:heme A synthase [Thermosporothrix hazakensis]PZW31980.1 cytochrome c oxidase assembly protein subunit 15 [Thermosporothrix hazakensis]GCE49694.1 heme A synthase [Thermosporothrix hazakensis]